MILVVILDVLFPWERNGEFEIIYGINYITTQMSSQQDNYSESLDEAE